MWHLAFQENGLAAKSCRRLHYLLETSQIEKCSLQTQDLKGFVHPNPCRSPTGVMRRCGVLHHTGQTSATFGEKFATSSVLLTLESGPAVYCAEDFWRALAPKFRTILQFNACRLCIGVGDLICLLPSSKPSSISLFFKLLGLVLHFLWCS